MSLSTFCPIWVCDTLIKLYICNDKIHTRKSKVLNFFGKLKFDEKADIVMHSRSMQRCVWNLPRSCTSIRKSRENIYVGQQQQKRQTSRSSTIGALYGFPQTWISCSFLGCFSLAAISIRFRMFVETILSLKNCWQLRRHGLCLRRMIKKLNWIFDFRFMLFTDSFRLMLCKAVSKEGCDRK